MPTSTAFEFTLPDPKFAGTQAEIDVQEFLLLFEQLEREERGDTEPPCAHAHPPHTTSATTHQAKAVIGWVEQPPRRKRDP